MPQTLTQKLRPGKSPCGWLVDLVAHRVPDSPRIQRISHGAKLSLSGAGFVNH